MNGALRKAMGEIGHGIDPRAWAQVHPWLTLAAASVAGFVTAAAVVPSEEDQLLKRLKKLEKSLDDSKYQKEAERRKDAATDGKKIARNAGFYRKRDLQDRAAHGRQHAVGGDRAGGRG